MSGSRLTHLNISEFMMFGMMKEGKTNNQGVMLVTLLLLVAQRNPMEKTLSYISFVCVCVCVLINWFMLL